jgi:hypothetical protein
VLYVAVTEVVVNATDFVVVPVAVVVVSAVSMNDYAVYDSTALPTTITITNVHSSSVLLVCMIRTWMNPA